MRSHDALHLLVPKSLDAGQEISLGFETPIHREARKVNESLVFDNGSPINYLQQIQQEKKTNIGRFKKSLRPYRNK